MKLSDNVIFITGGSSGIGLTLAEVFLNLQNTAIVCGRNPQKLQSVKNKYPGIHTVQCDISKEEEVRQALEKMRTEFNGLNILINNAGIQNNYVFYEENNALKKIDVVK